MVQAALRGAVDFARGDPDDLRWWLRLFLLLDAIETDHLIRLSEGYNRNELAALSIPDLTRESIGKIQQATSDRMRQISDLRMPWLKRDTPRTGLEDEFQRLSAAWEKEYGRLDDPATQIKIQQTVAQLNRDNLALRRVS